MPDKEICIGGTPNEKQKIFLGDQHRHVAYGGARGGGKSWAVRVKALLLCLSWYQLQSEDTLTLFSRIPST